MVDIIDESVVKGLCAGCEQEPNRDEGVYLEIIEARDGPKLAFICKKHKQKEFLWDLPSLRTQLIRLNKKSLKPETPEEAKTREATQVN